LRHYYKRKISDPEKIPDISITSAKDISLSWQSLLVPIELESEGNVKEGMGQVIAYMACILSAQVEKKNSCVGIYSDGRTIDFLRMFPVVEHEPFVFHTGELVFLPKIRPSTPTPGFFAFIRLLSATLENFNAMHHPSSVTVNGCILTLNSFIAVGCKSRVYASKVDGKDVAVKIQEGLQNSRHFTAETTTLRDLNRADPAGKFFPLLMPCSTANTLVLFPLGKETLRTYRLNVVLSPKDALAITEKVLQIS
jgi:hypothetical protein